MSKPFRLKMARRFRRIQRGPRPHWRHHSGNYAHQVFAEVWSHVCDRWAKK